MVNSNRRCLGIMNPSENLIFLRLHPSASAANLSFAVTFSRKSPPTPKPGADAPAPGSYGALYQWTEAAWLVGELHKIGAISTFSTNIRPGQCLPHVSTPSGRSGGGGGEGVPAEVLNSIMLRWEQQSTGGQGIHMNKVSDLGQVHARVGVCGGGLVSSSESEDNSTSLIGRYKDQIKE